MSDWFPEIDVPTLPVVDLVTGRRGSSESEVTEQDLYDSQIRWDFISIYRLEPDRRKELCSLLSKLLSKAPGLKGSDAAQLWSRVAKSPEWPDELMSPPDIEEDMD